MKNRFPFVLVLAICLALLPAARAPAQGAQPGLSATTPPPREHIPYRPPVRPAATLPQYPYNALHPSGAPNGMSVTSPL